MPCYFPVAVQLNHGLWPQKGRHEKTSDDEWNLITKGMKMFEDDDEFCWDLYNTMAIKLMERDEEMHLDCFDPLEFFDCIQFLPEPDEDKTKREQIREQQIINETHFVKHLKTTLLEWHIFNNTYKGFWKHLADTIITYGKNNPTRIVVFLTGELDSD